LAEATGEASQTVLTSKVSSMMMVFLKKIHLRHWARKKRSQLLIPNPRRKSQRLRKKRSLKRKLKKSFSVSASMTSLLQDKLAKKLRPERLRALRVSTSSLTTKLKVKKLRIFSRRVSRLELARRVATSFLDLLPLLKTKKNKEVVAPAGVAEEAEEVGQTGRTNLLLPREVTLRRLSRG